MAILNGINVKDAEFTAMQEKATAAICKQSFQNNKTVLNYLLNSYY